VKGVFVLGFICSVTKACHLEVLANLNAKTLQIVTTRFVRARETISNISADDKRCKELKNILLQAADFFQKSIGSSLHQMINGTVKLLSH
jgi:hypothetical protein